MTDSKTTIARKVDHSGEDFPEWGQQRKHVDIEVVAKGLENGASRVLVA